MQKYNIQNIIIGVGANNKYVISISNIVPQFQDGLIFEFFVTS